MIARLGQREELLKSDLCCGGWSEIAAPDDMRDAARAIIDDAGQLVRHGSIASSDDGIAEVGSRNVIERNSRFILQGVGSRGQHHAQHIARVAPFRAADTLLAAGPWVSHAAVATTSAVFAEFFPRAATTVEMPRFCQAIECVGVPLGMLALDLFDVEIETEPCEIVAHGFRKYGLAALRIEILEAQDRDSAARTKVEPAQ